MIDEDKSSIVLLVQNSHRVFCYFSVSAVEIKGFQDRYGENSWKNSKPVLKVYEVINGIVSEIKTIYIDAFANNWFINLEKDDIDVFVKLGRVLVDDTFVALAVSNTVTTPRDKQSGDSAVYYVDISEDFIAPSNNLPTCGVNKNENCMHKEPKPYPFVDGKKKLDHIPSS
ncbi:DUF4912 domain-containing protein [Clostridium neuense]|uniref:DUF4912 domain-containing protein n=1 Tax=Clostridium neuense TaxID=1728934 RepID=A0ABW8TEY9_9CLOT